MVQGCVSDWVGEWSNNAIFNDKDGFPVTLRFGNVVGGLASGFHPLLGFD